MKNEEIRALIKSRRIRHYEVAAQLGVNEATFCRWLRNELPPEKKKQVLAAIDSIAL